jgi:hypothetical protein
MPDIDSEAAGILIESGLDVPTAMAGAIINVPLPRAKHGPRASASRNVGVIIGVAMALAYVVWRSF